ncbi:hypothetical protein SAMN05192553_1188 [Cyclobacterium xiamenense]|uniref:CRISPR type III-B/RAMP module-associated protein Cmr5 n=1 Tax=Cyclobacterium xiamenense TaxID=1297121 RepID=A0A1H7C5G8_9BACT|nr:hypothetical protein [Cyclobacterium xiamenense]SEJ81870.1 hypothetical protein SAMN05192553_1188 [Cyclobacterium xiamenense]
MNKRIEQMIPLAFSAVEESQGLVENGAISKQYNGYIASFGASVVLSGMLMSLIYNHRNSTDQHRVRSEKDKSPLFRALFQVVKQYRNDTASQSGDLLAYYQACTDKRLLKSQIMDAAVAIKLVVRTFKLVD